MDQDRTARMMAFLDREHWRFRGRPDVAAGSDEIALTARWRLVPPHPSSALLRRMIADFQKFCREGFALELGESESGTSPAILWELTGDEPGGPQDPRTEAFEITVSAEAVTVRARHERGLLHGTHHLEWLMSDRGGPVLPIGTAIRTPAFMPRISNGVFIPGHQSPRSPGAFSDDYLSLMSHFGANGIHLYLDLWSIFRSAILPELNSPGFDEEIAALRAFSARTRTFGIDVYLHVNTPPLMEDHPVFQAHPEIRGARVEILIEEISGRPWHNLCSGREKVHAAYGEALGNLFRATDDVAGMMMIIGGECFYHCFTRPAGASNGGTNCPHCQGKSASAQVAALVNTAARALKACGKSLYAWPYSAFVWSSQDPAEEDFIRQLDPEVSLLANFDWGDADAHLGGGARNFDYNLTCIGPSETFARQSALCREAGRPIFAKVETCTMPEAFFVPYLPLPYRWSDRIQAMKKSGVAGFVGQWRFFGMNGSLPEEIQYKAVWSDGGIDALLKNVCRRDFGLDDAQGDEVLRGWRLLSEAWSDFPYSAMTCGERAAYMRGPFYLGPAHPLIFDVQDGYGLPPVFRSLRGDLSELATTPEERAELERKAKPRYVSDLLITLPYGVERYLELLGACRKKWTAGLSAMRPHLEGGTERAQMELGICETLDIHFRTLDNVVRFYRIRDQMSSESTDPGKFADRLRELTLILDDEIENARRILPILARDFRVGYGHSYGEVYDRAMVEAKIRQCEYVRDQELPRFIKVIRSHVWLESP